MEELTPMLQQYRQIKSRYNNCVLFFRLGDFYEMFGEDARKACGILEVVLTSRDAGKAGRIPMCGIPYHAADTYIAKLIKAGLKVAICEQTEDPQQAKGLVKREVTRVITSGTYIDEASYESRKLLCLAVKEKKWGLAFTDTSSGIIHTNQYGSMQQLIEAIAQVNAYECVFPEAEEKMIKEIFHTPLLQKKNITLSAFEDWNFNTEIAQKTIFSHFSVGSLKGFGIDDLPACTAASGALLAYLKHLHKQPLKHLHRISLYADSQFLYISPAAGYGLELERLFSTIDFTRTSMGRRMLRSWLYHPLKIKDEIIKRQNAVTLLKENAPLQEELGRLLHAVADVEKAVSRISTGIGQPKDLLAISLTLNKQPDMQKLFAMLTRENDLFALKDIVSLRETLAEALNPQMSLSHPEGTIIKKGYHKPLDELKQIHDNAKELLKHMQAEEVKRTGINSLKIGYNHVFGYYIEISKTNLDRVPADFIRKQTLANAERYITPRLKEFEEKILGAEEEIVKIERTLVETLFELVLTYAAELQIFSYSLASIDSLYSLSALSKKNGYIASGINDGFEILIRDGRHPVVEELTENAFIPNDTSLDCQDNHLVILTGPNMAGKSTYIRQTALLVILAQMGSYIPASSAAIGIVDKIFTRIGAHDDIAKGHSTFMVEMSETAGILNNLSERSLVVLDEIGRGTSTFDGLSLAWAIAEYLARAKVKTLFATHFHELTSLSEEFTGVKNYNVQVREWKDEIIFLHKIVPGGTDDSYGIYVAKLAGIPKPVVKRAEQILSRLELTSNLQEKIKNRLPQNEQLSLFSPQSTLLWEEVRKKILEADLDDLTGLQALEMLNEVKKRIEKNG